MNKNPDSFYCLLLAERSDFMSLPRDHSRTCDSFSSDSSVRRWQRRRGFFLLNAKSPRRTRAAAPTRTASSIQGQTVLAVPEYAMLRNQAKLESGLFWKLSGLARLRAHALKEVHHSTDGRRAHKDLERGGRQGCKSHPWLCSNDLKAKLLGVVHA